MNSAADTPVVQTFMELAAISSPAHEEAPAAAYARSFLSEAGIAVSEDNAGAEIPAGCGNLHAMLAPTCAGTPLFFCAHLDTVTLADVVVPQLRDDGTITNARDAILGADDKSAVAVMLHLMRDLVANATAHAGVEIVLTPCEEVGLLGAKAFDVATLTAKQGYVFDHADDIGTIVLRAPSQVSIRGRFHGVAAHSGIAPEEGKSAVAAAAQAISAMRLGRIDASTTANVGIITGGSAVNIVPEYCDVRAEARSLEHNIAVATADEMVEHMLDAANEYGIDVDIDCIDEYRAYAHREQTPAVRRAATALEEAGFPVRYADCGGGSDGNVFNQRGISCVNLCNGMRQIHTTDEHIAVGDLNGMLAVAHRIVSLARDN